jgi:hypothetical protein
MLNKLLQKPKKIDHVMFATGCFLGIFPEGSIFGDYKYIFETENEINSMLQSIMSSLQLKGMIFYMDADHVVWNDDFKVNTFLQEKEKQKENKKLLAKKSAIAKSALRKFVNVSQIIEGCGLKVKVKSVDAATMSIYTTVISNDKWEHVFDVNEEVMWHFNSCDNENFIIFEADSKNQENGQGAQSLLYIIDGKCSVERDS